MLKKGFARRCSLAIYLLQQALEKTVKGVAIASGQFEDKELRKEYSHNSLRLLSDVILKLIEIPAIQSALLVMKAGLGKTSEKYLDVNDVCKGQFDSHPEDELSPRPHHLFQGRCWLHLESALCIGQPDSGSVHPARDTAR